MSDVMTFNEAKSRFSEIIDRIIYKKEKITITKKGKKVAVVVPVEESTQNPEQGLIKAKGILGDIDDSVDEMIDAIYESRRNEKAREVIL